MLPSEIANGLREMVDTPTKYTDLYKRCWQTESAKRPPFPSPEVSADASHKIWKFRSRSGRPSSGVPEAPATVRLTMLRGVFPGLLLHGNSALFPVLFVQNLSTGSRF